MLVRGKMKNKLICLVLVSGLSIGQLQAEVESTSQVDVVIDQASALRAFVNDVTKAPKAPGQLRPTASQLNVLIQKHKDALLTLLKDVKRVFKENKPGMISMVRKNFAAAVYGAKPTEEMMLPELNYYALSLVLPDNAMGLIFVSATTPKEGYSAAERQTVLNAIEKKIDLLEGKK
jgi:hypothetical protein